MVISAEDTMTITAITTMERKVKTSTTFWAFLERIQAAFLGVAFGMALKGMTYIYLFLFFSSL